MDILLGVGRELVVRKVLTYPVVWLQPDCLDRQQLAAAVKRLGGTLAATEGGKSGSSRQALHSAAAAASASAATAAAVAAAAVASACSLLFP